MDDAKRDFSAAPGEEIVSDSRCFVCGLKNVGGLQVRFFRQNESSAFARCAPPPAFTGYEGLLHGGVTAALLDEIMIKAILGQGRIVVTGRMSISYHRPVPMSQTLVLRGSIRGVRGRMYDTEGTLEDEQGRRLASAVGTYVEVTGLQRAELERSLGS